MSEKKSKNKKDKNMKAVIAILAVLIVVAAGVAVYMSAQKPEAPESSSSAQSSSSIESSTSAKESESASEEQTEAQSTEKQTTVTTKKPVGYELPLTVNEALDALYEHYGNDLEINRTIEENGINYFAVYKDGEKYASVSVDLVTGKATETITSTGDKVQFSLI